MVYSCCSTAPSSSANAAMAAANSPAPSAANRSLAVRSWGAGGGVSRHQKQRPSYIIGESGERCGPWGGGRASPHALCARRRCSYLRRRCDTRRARAAPAATWCPPSPRANRSASAWRDRWDVRRPWCRAQRRRAGARRWNAARGTDLPRLGAITLSVNLFSADLCPPSKPRLNRGGICCRQGMGASGRGADGEGDVVVGRAGGPTAEYGGASGQQDLVEALGELSVATWALADALGCGRSPAADRVAEQLERVATEIEALRLRARARLRW